MTAINQIIHVGFYFLLALSGATIFSIIILVLFRLVSKKDYVIPKAIATWAGICTSVGSFSLAILNFNFPIGILPESDPAREAIRAYYDFIQARNCDGAWNLIHSARKKILAEESRFGRDQFCEAYKTTQIYEGLGITKVVSKADLISSRTYVVTYDVSDSLPRNDIYDLYLKDFSDVIASGSLNGQTLTDDIIKNLQHYFVVPEEHITEIKGIIENMPFWYVAEPEMISELQRLLSLKYHIVLKPQVTPPPLRRIVRHYVHRITMMLDGDQWKIREGLSQPVLIAPFLARDKLL